MADLFESYALVLTGAGLFAETRVGAIYSTSGVADGGKFVLTDPTTGQISASMVTGSGSVSFDGVLSGTNANTLSVTGSLTTTGGGVIQATQVQLVIVSATPPSVGQVLTATSPTMSHWATPVTPSYPVTSVFTRTGDIVALSGDYAAFYDALGAATTAQAAAEAFATAADTVVLASAEAFATSAANTAQSNAETFATSQGYLTAVTGAAYFDALGAAAAALAAAETFTTSQGYLTAVTGAGYFDALGAAATAQSNAEGFATAADVVVLSTAEAFTTSSIATLIFPANTPAVSHEFVTAYDSSTGVFIQVQPAYTDISGTPQLPVTFSPVTNEFLTGYTASSGLFTATQPSFSNIGGLLATSQLATVQGNGSKVQLSTGTTTTGDVVTFDANGNTVNSGTLLTSLALTSSLSSYALLAGPTFSGTVTIPTLALTGTQTVGTGASLIVTGTGSVEATQIQAVVFSSSAPSVGQIPVATSATTAAWQNNSGGGSLVGYRKTATHYLAGSAAPTAIQDTGAGIAGAQGAVAAVPASRQAAAYQYNSTGTATPAGYQSAVNNTFDPWWFDGPNLSLFVDAYVGQTVTERVWIGLFDNLLSTATIFGSDTLHANQYAAFRYSTVAGDTAWQCVVCDGTTQNVVSSGVAIDTKSHRFVIICNDSTPNVQFYIDGVLVATITTNTPTTSQAKVYMVVGLTSTAAVTSSIFFTQALIQQDY